MIRIPLTDEDMDIDWAGNYEDYNTFILIVGQESRNEHGQKKLEALKKQILDDYEFSNSFDVKIVDGEIVSIPIKELKEKAEKYDGLVKEYGQHLEHHIKLEQEIKQLKEKFNNQYDTILELRKERLKNTQGQPWSLTDDEIKQILDNQEKAKMYDAYIKIGITTEELRKALDLEK